MSLLGHDALGHWALGHPPDSTATITVLVVATASYTLTANAVTESIIENISPAAFVLAGQGVTEKEIEAVSVANFAVTGNSVSARFLMPLAPAAFVVTANPTTEFETEVIAPASFAVTFNNVPLVWTGAGIDTSYSGGVGHYKLDLERARQLAKITRKVPPPVDLRTAPTFKAVGSPPIAPAIPAPMMQPIPNQGMAEAAAKAKVIKQRRDIEAILLLAS
jgi:hypothetical protein